MARRLTSSLPALYNPVFAQRQMLREIRINDKIKLQLQKHETDTYIKNIEDDLAESRSYAWLFWAVACYSLTKPSSR